MSQFPVSNELEDLLPPRKRGGLWHAVQVGTAGFSEALFHPITCALALAGLLLGAFFFSPLGDGFMTCGFYTATQLPCPACGLTRSVTSILHGHPAWAFRFNPLGFGFAFVFVILGPLTFLTKAARRRLIEKTSRYDAYIASVALTFLVIMIVHGLVRMGLILGGVPGFEWWRESGPPSWAK